MCDVLRSIHVAYRYAYTHFVNTSLYIIIRHFRLRSSTIYVQPIVKLFKRRKLNATFYATLFLCLTMLHVTMDEILLCKENVEIHRSMRV